MAVGSSLDGSPPACVKSLPADFTCERVSPPTRFRGARSARPKRTSMDTSALRRYCLDRVQREIKAAGCTAALFADPVNVRYATGTSNMVVWLLHNQGRYCLVPAEG